MINIVVPVFDEDQSFYRVTKENAVKLSKDFDWNNIYDKAFYSLNNV